MNFFNSLVLSLMVAAVALPAVAAKEATPAEKKAEGKAAAALDTGAEDAAKKETETN